MLTTELLLTAQLCFPLQLRAATRRRGHRCGAGMRQRCRCGRVITIDVLDIVVFERMLHTVNATGDIIVAAAAAAIIANAHTIHTVIIDIIVVIIAEAITIAAVAVEQFIRVGVHVFARSGRVRCRHRRRWYGAMHQRTYQFTLTVTQLSRCRCRRANATGCCVARCWRATVCCGQYSGAVEWTRSVVRTMLLWLLRTF